MRASSAPEGSGDVGAPRRFTFIDRLWAKAAAEQTSAQLASAPDTARLHQLDYLRGVAALGIMLYHFTSWSFGEQSAHTALGRVGVYGVAIFYVLSGLTLFHVYQERMQGARDVGVFAVRRLFRILPLLWLVTLASIVINRAWPGITDVLLNLSGLFGFVAWDAYIATGAWSIGNELVFYAIFPMLVFATRRSAVLLGVVVVLVAAPYFGFAFWGLDSASPLSAQWSVYVHPGNQAFLFVGGFVIGALLRRRTVPQWAAWGVLVAAVVLFVTLPSGTGQITVVTGWSRVVFTLLCLLACAAVYKIRMELPGVLHAPLATLGEASYSLYLIHPLVWRTVGFVGGDRLPVALQFVVSATLALVGSYVCYRFFEKRFMAMGRRVMPARKSVTLATSG